MTKGKRNISGKLLYALDETGDKMNKIIIPFWISGLLMLIGVLKLKGGKIKWN